MFHFRILFILLYHLFNPYAEVETNQYLIGHWNFNGNAKDISGNNHHATVYGASLTSDSWGNEECAYLFNGQSDFIKVAHSETLNFTNRNIFSLCVRLKVNGFYSDPCHGNSVLSKGVDNDPGTYGINFSDFAFTEGQNCVNAEIDVEHQNFAFIHSQSRWDQYYDQPIVTNTWYNLVMVSDGFRTKTYQNGQLVGSYPIFGKRSMNTSDLFFGRMDHDMYPYWFNGVIDDIRIYDKDLSAKEIDDLYKQNDQRH